MASRVRRRWLEHELPSLVEAGVVPAEVAERIRAHYSESRRLSAAPLFAVLGSGLIGLGVVLLLAANWEELSRPLRAALSLALLLAAQATAGFAWLRHRVSAAWCEATALGLALAVAAATALVTQTYQVQGDLRDFLSTWLFLIVALPYLFDARAVAALYLVGASGWLGATLGADGSRLLFWVFIVLLAPYLVGVSRRAEGALRGAFLSTVAMGAIAFGSVVGFRVARLDLLVWIASLVAAGVYALGVLLDRGRGSAIRYATLPSKLAGLAISLAFIALTYNDTWDFVGEKLDGGGTATWIDHAGAAGVMLAFGALALSGARRLLRARDWPRVLLAGSPLVLGAGILADIGPDRTSYAGAVLAGLWALAFCIGTVLGAMGDGDLRRGNAGLLLLAILIFTRFSDWNSSFTLRGLVFIGFGAGFLLLNLRWRLRGHPRTVNTSAGRSA